MRVFLRERLLHVSRRFCLPKTEAASLQNGAALFLSDQHNSDFD